MSTKTAVLAVASTTATLVAVLPLAIGLSSSAPPATNDGSAVAMAAYDRAAAAMADAEPACTVPSWLLAAVGEIESNHGSVGDGVIAMDGTVSPPIIGPTVAGLRDTDSGRWDELTGEDRAVGPMQFLPSTWTTVGRDGNSDGIVDPQNLFDAALSAAVYLCEAAGPMATEAQWREGLLAYNHSTAYIDAVLTAGQRYQDSAASTPGALVEVPGIGLTSAAWAEQVRSLLAAAQQDGITLTGHSYRDRAAQVLLRRAHCGTSHYAVYDMPASACHPPTARPGTSLHERGLAIDFDNCSTHATRCYRWLEANAARYGLFNLPSEPWHWSSSGG